jgi:two-component system response regulator AtoC
MATANLDRGTFAQNRQHILIIDDEDNMRHMLSVMLSRQGYHTEQAPDGREGLKLLTEKVFDYVLCDIRMPEMDGKTFLTKALAEGLATPVIMMSAYGSVDTAIECMKLGAYDFISKPFKKDEIVMVLKKAEERERLKEENKKLRETALDNFSYGGILSRNARMKDIFSQIQKIADLKTTILVLGESGTGKELVARAIHANGKRTLQNFVAVNCAAIPETLLESELFGHVKGAFTDASIDKAGLFEHADCGTLFLDEIGEMPSQLQVKLLRVLQEGEIRRVGATVSKKVDVRVVSATSRDLALAVEQGIFREDLFFRLNVFSLQLPPLRERVEDIPLLVEHFLRKYDCSKGNILIRIEPDAMRLLMAYQWPGNVRELENVMERASILCDNGVITAGVLPVTLSMPDGCVPEGEGTAGNENLSIRQAEHAIELELIRKALARTGGNRTHAAKILEISHRSLLYKMKEYGID